MRGVNLVLHVVSYNYVTGFGKTRLFQKNKIATPSKYIPLYENKDHNTFSSRVLARLKWERSERIMDIATNTFKFFLYLPLCIRYEGIQVLKVL